MNRTPKKGPKQFQNKMFSQLQSGRPTDIPRDHACSSFRDFRSTISNINQPSQNLDTAALQISVSHVNLWRRPNDGCESYAANKTMTIREGKPRHERKKGKQGAEEKAQAYSFDCLSQRKAVLDHSSAILAVG